MDPRTQERVGGTTKVNVEDTSKPWSLNDEYRFTPGRPDGDPWKVLLDPLLEKDKIQCDGWKDEVGNLLIFAGLFSAVVTAFIIESYKTLQPDPNDDIIALLSQIANQSNNAALEPRSILLPSQSFSPKHSAVRVNIFWFLSLIYSLASVVIGTVTLQWLRQHQAYPGQSPREALAMYYMRSEGMQKWHVWKILMALPVLLQLALVFFFVGVIDFLHELGNKAVLIPISVAIGFTLLFLYGTATLPALQTCFLTLRGLMSWPHKKPPSQCPYKSPQSAVMCSIFDVFLRLCSYPRSLFSLGIKRSPVRQYLHNLRATKSWIDFDLLWLKVRDAYSRIIFDEDFYSRNQANSILHSTPPLFDAMNTFRNVTRSDFDEKLTSETISAAYHCLSDLSSVFTISNLAQGKDLKSDLDSISLWNRYLQFSFDAQFGLSEPTAGPSESASPSDVVRLIHDRNLYTFLGRLDNYIDPTNDILIHRQEIKVRIQQYVLGSKSALPANVSYPTYLQFRHDQNLWRNFPHQENLFLHQYMHILHGFFDYASRLGTNISQTDLQARPETLGFLREISRTISRITGQLVRSQTHGYSQASEALTHLLNDITAGLGRIPASKPEDLIHILYCASMFACGQAFPNGQISPPAESYKKLLSEIRSYRKDTNLNMDGANGEAEKAFKSKYPSDDAFSQELWPLLAYRGTDQNPIPFSIPRGSVMPQPQHFGALRYK